VTRAKLYVLAVILAQLSAPAFAASSVCTALASPPACTDPECSERELESLHLVPADNPIAVPNAVSQAVTDFLCAGRYAGWRHDLSPRTNNIRLTGPFIDTSPTTTRALTTHAQVRVYYSKGVVKWLEGGRQGAIPDGAMIVKEMFALPVYAPVGKTPSPSGWAVIVRNSRISHDGWLWYLFYLPHNQTTKIEFQSVQYGMSFCISCHSSSDRDQGTFAFLGNLQGHDAATYVATRPVVTHDKTNLTPDTLSGNPHERFASVNTLLDQMMYKPTLSPNDAINVDLWRLLRKRAGLSERPDTTDFARLPQDAVYDHVVAPAGETKRLFLTSDACSGCHDASDLLNTVDPNMTVPFPVARFPMANVSPYGEWSGSLMAVSARDPVFRSQLESELVSLSSPDARAQVQQLCMSCHEVMGERQDPALARQPGSDYAVVSRRETSHDRATIEKATFGALARDGVSCTVCHHIAPEKLGTKESFTAHFETGPAAEVYGPYPDVKTHPMKNAIGLTPMHGAQIENAGLCGSCHVVDVPVFSGDGTLAKQPYAHEQTTYLEWANSAYAVKGREYQTCQDCHMPRTNPVTKQPLATSIVNIEDTTFPYVPNRADSDQLDTVVRDSYWRHTLTGINVFVMAMFQEFPLILGSNTFLPNRAPNVLPPKTLALGEALEQARERSADLHIEGVTFGPEQLDVQVRVMNLAGHKLPSGVGFRRAFLEFSVLDKSGDVIWCSGCTDDLGVIVDGDGNRLASEFATQPNELQPDYARITKETQVQIYESRHVDCAGALTTSFVHLCDEVKDNRILPKGWSSSGPFAEETRPKAVSGKISPGVDVVSYSIPRREIPQAAAIRVALHYQSIPPYYLVDRASLLGGGAAGAAHPEAERLLYMVLHLGLADPQVGAASWKVPLACQQRPIKDGDEKPCLKAESGSP